MNLFEFYSLSLFRGADDGLYIFQPLGRFGPAFRLKAEQRGKRAAFLLVSTWVLMFLATWGSQTLETGVAHVRWFLLVCVFLVLLCLLAGAGLQRTKTRPPRTPEERAAYCQYLREHAGVRWVVILPSFISVWLGHGVGSGFTADGWSSLFMVLGVFTVLIALFSRFWVRSRRTQPSA